MKYNREKFLVLAKAFLEVDHEAQYSNLRNEYFRLTNLVEELIRQDVLTKTVGQLVSRPEEVYVGFYRPGDSAKINFIVDDLSCLPEALLTRLEEAHEAYNRAFLRLDAYKNTNVNDLAAYRKRIALMPHDGKGEVTISKKWLDIITTGLEN